MSTTAGPDMAGSGEVTMRDMSMGDIDAVLEIEKVSFVAPWTRGMFEETLASPVGMSLVAEEEGRIVGYLAASEIHVMNIAVKQDRRGLGLASWMMSRVMDLGRRNSMETCFLEVRESNVPARGLYEKLGFRQIGRRKGYYRETGEDAIVMELVLNDAT